MSELIDKQQAIDKITKRLFETAFNNVGIKQNIDETLVDVAENRLENWFNELPSAEPESISKWKKEFREYVDSLDIARDDWKGIIEYIDELPSIQPNIIRCKDCIYQTESWSGIKYCEAHGDHIGKDYDYCSNARRKEDGQTDFTASGD